MSVHWHDDECGYCPCDETDSFTRNDTAIPADILFDIALDMQVEWRAEDREWIRDDYVGNDE